MAEVDSATEWAALIDLAEMLASGEIGREEYDAAVDELGGEEEGPERFSESSRQEIIEARPIPEPPPAPIINIHLAPVINIPERQVNVQAPTVNVSPPPPAQITVEAPAAVHLPPPLVTVEAPVVHLPAPQVTVNVPHPSPAPTVTRMIERDKDGLITRVTEKPDGGGGGQ